MPTLAEQFAAPDKRKRVVSDLAALVDTEVGKKGGLGGLAIKGAYSVVKAIKPTFVRDVIEGMFNDCVARLEPIYQECLAAGAAFTTKWNAKGSQIADALLAVTDGRAERTSHTSAKKAYLRLRPSAKRNVEEAVPGLGQVLVSNTKP